MTKKPTTTNAQGGKAPGSTPPVRSSARAAAKPPPLPGVSPPAIPAAAPAPNVRAGVPTKASAAPPSKGPPRPSVRPAGSPDRAALEALGQSLAELRALVGAIAADVDRVRGSERGLSAEGESALSEIAVRLRRAVGVAVRNTAPPPATARARALSILDISEMAELVDSLAPPPLEGAAADEPEIVVDDSWTDP